MDIIIDTETLGKRCSTTLLSFAAIPLDFKFPSEDEIHSRGFYRKFNAKEQLKKGRTFDEDTMEWWKSQPDASEVLQPSPIDVTVEQFREDLYNWLKTINYDFKNDFIWVRGAAFDPPIIQSLFYDFNLKNPMNFWKVRDIRTLIDISTGSRNGLLELKYTPEWIVKHNALHDCILDYLRIKQLYSEE